MVNLNRDFGLPRQRAFAHQDTRAKSAAAVVDLGLRQVERVLTFDIARAHIVANVIAGDAAAWADHQSQFRLGYGPGGISPDPDLAAGADGAAGCGFEE